MRANLEEIEYSYNDSLKKYKKHKAAELFIFNKVLYRPAASLLVKLFYRTRITPNQLTLVSFAFGVFASLCFLGARYNYFVIGGALLQLSQLFDLTDGMIARAKGTGSDFGAYLDIFLDRVTDFLLLSGIVIGYYLYSNNLTVFLIGLSSIALYFLQVTLFYITTIYVKKTKPGETEETRAAMILIILILSILNRLDLFIFFLAIETTMNVLFRTGYLFRMKKHFK